MHEQKTDNTFIKKVGRKTYKVHVQFNKNSKENFNSKLMRVIKNEIADIARLE